MVTECLLNHIPPSLSEAHYTIYRGMNSELVMLEKLSRLAGLGAVILLFVKHVCVFVWWCFLFGVIRPLRKS